jgi:rubrerythrin
MDDQNILHNNLLLNDPDMAQGLPQGAQNVGPPQQNAAGAAGGGQPPQNVAGALGGAQAPQNVQNQAVHDLADLIDRVAIAQPLQPIQPQAQRVIPPRPLDRPLAVMEEQLPLSMVRNEIQREAQTLDLLGRLTRLVTAEHQHVEDLNNPQRNQLQALLEGMGHIQQNMRNNQVLLQNAQLKAKRYRNAIDMPQFLPRDDQFVRYPQDISGKNIKNNAPVFNPAVPGADFRVTWHRLKDYGDQNLFDEREYIVALGQVLEEQAYLEYVQLRENGTSLRGILEHMEEIYVPKKSYYEDQAAVDNFHRNKGENIQKAMRRALLCVEKLRHSVPDTDWPVLLKKYMEDILFKIVSPSTQKYLRKLNEVYTESGLTYDLHTMIQKADMHEVTNDSAPKTEMPLKVTNSVLVTDSYPQYYDRPVPMDTSNNYTKRNYANSDNNKSKTGSDWYNRDRQKGSNYSPDNRERSRDRQYDRNKSYNPRESSQSRYNQSQNGREYKSYDRDTSRSRNSSQSNRDRSNDRYRNSSRDRYRDNRSRDRSNSRDRNSYRNRDRDNRSYSRDRNRSDSKSYSRSDSRDRRENTPAHLAHKGEKGNNSTTAKAKAVNIVLKDKSYYSCNVCSSLHAEDRCPLAGNR